MVKQRLIYLDLIRIFVFLCIIIIHFNASVSGYDISGQFIYPNHLIPNNYFGVYLGSIGVGLFFILSGACLQYSSQNSDIDVKSLLTFWKKRVLSLFPMYWTVFFFFTLFSFWINKALPPVKPLHWVESLTGFDGYFMLMGWGGAENYQCGEWFLGCILILYIVFPFLSCFFNKFPKSTTIITSVVYAMISNRFVYHWFFMQIPLFILGMIFIKYFKTALSWKLWVPTFVLVLIKINCGNHLSQHTNGLILCWIIFLLIILATEIINKYSLLFSKDSTIKNISYLSMLTYPLYLVHHKVCWYLARNFDLTNFPYRNTVFLFLIYIIMTSFISIVFINFERYFKKSSSFSKL